MKKLNQKEDLHLTLTDLSKKDKAFLTSVDKSIKLNIETVASKLAVEVAFLLSEQIDELNVNNSEFRVSLKNVCMWVLNSTLKREEKCIIFPDCIPGFTVMCFKRNSIESDGSSVDISTTPQGQAIALIIDRFLGKSDGVVLILEAKDFIITLFPVSDLKNNLKLLGFMS